MSTPFIFLALVCLTTTLAQQLPQETQKCITDCQANNKWIDASDSWAGDTRNEILDKFCPIYQTMLECFGTCVGSSGSALSDFMKKMMPEEVDDLIDSCSSYSAGLSVVPAHGVVIAVTVPAAMIVLGRMLLV